MGDQGAEQQMAAPQPPWRAGLACREILNPELWIVVGSGVGLWDRSPPPPSPTTGPSLWLCFLPPASPPSSLDHSHPTPMSLSVSWNLEVTVGKSHTTVMTGWNYDWLKLLPSNFPCNLLLSLLPKIKNQVVISVNLSSTSQHDVV